MRTGISARQLICAAAIIAISAPVFAQAPKINWDIDEAIKQIERQANDFGSAMARANVVNVDADGNEVSRSTGTVFVREDGRMRYNNDDGNLVTLVDKNKVMIHDKSSKTVNEYALRKHKDRLEPFTRLGFSTTGKDLRDNYLVTILGEEEIGDARTVVLELTPKRDNVRATVRQVRLWIDQSSWMPKQQEFSSTADGGKMTLTFSGMARNLRLNQDLFKEKWPKGTEEIRN